MPEISPISISVWITISPNASPVSNDQNVALACDSLVMGVTLPAIAHHVRSALVHSFQQSAKANLIVESPRTEQVALALSQLRAALSMRGLATSCRDQAAMKL